MFLAPVGRRVNIGPMATIRQVAKVAEVSPGTVSQMLNGRGQLRPETRQRIEHAINRLGYRRRRAGRPSTSNPSHHIAMLVSGRPSTNLPTHPLRRQRVAQLREAVLAAGDHFSLLPADVPVEENWAFGDAVRSGHVDAVVVDGDAERRGYARWLREQGVPAVVFERTPEMNAFSCVCVDGVVGGTLAAEHLLERGHKRLAFVQPRRELSWTRERRHGFITALGSYGHEPAGVWRLDPDAQQPEHEQVARELAEHGVDGVFASSDGLAIMLIDGLASQCVGVPADVAVVGFDDLGLTSADGLRPTSIAYDHQYIARAVVRLLKQLLSDPQATVLATYVRPTVAVHDTT